MGYFWGSRRGARQPMTVIMLVDDRVTNLTILGQFAKSVEPGVTVCAFDNPVAALESLSETKPDLIVTDFLMPGLNGEEFVVRCREHPATSEVPIIVVTAYGEGEYRYRALEAGATDFLLNPVDGREFCTRARNLLTLRRQQLVIRKRAESLQAELEEAIEQHAKDVLERERKLRRVINTVPALVRASDTDGRLIFLNSYHERFFGFDLGEATGRAKRDLFGEVYGSRHLEIDRQMMESGGVVRDVEEVLTDREGRERVLLTNKAPLCDNEGSVSSIVTVSLDITELKRGEQAMRESEERFRSLVEGSVMGIVIDCGGKPVFANQTFADVFGYDNPDEILALDTLDPIYAPCDQMRIQHYRDARAKGESVPEDYEYQGRRKDGSLIWLQSRVRSILWKGQHAVQSTISDITLRKEYEERLQRQANFDWITDLPNRVLALDRLNSAVISARRHDRKVGLLYIDLDHFKKVNDTLGHAAGDQLLRQAAERIKRCVREEDTVARLSGDEFAIVLPDINTAMDTETVANKILEAFSLPFDLDGQEAFVTASIGVTVCPDDGDDPNVLIQNADAAMYRAKEQGRNTNQFFTSELNERAIARIRIEGLLRRALERKQLFLHYQPVVNIASGTTVCVEALLRWNAPGIGAVTPEQFVALAEDTGLIVPIGEWVLQTACRQIADWRVAGLPPVCLSVNISSRQFRGGGLVDSVSRALQENGMAASSLQLEITEGLLMDDLPDTKAALHELQTMGVRLAVDDFGTGYSSLSYLKRFPVTALKIDKSFIRDIPTDRGDATLVEAIVAMSHRLNLQVIGEGIENRSQLEFIRSRGCDLAQGHYFSRPLPPEEFSRISRSWDNGASPGKRDFGLGTL